MGPSAATTTTIRATTGPRKLSLHISEGARAGVLQGPVGPENHYKGWCQWETSRTRERLKASLDSNRAERIASQRVGMLDMATSASVPRP